MIFWVKLVKLRLNLNLVEEVRGLGKKATSSRLTLKIHAVFFKKQGLFFFSKMQGGEGPEDHFCSPKVSLLQFIAMAKAGF